MVDWSKGLAVVAALSIVAALIVSIGSFLLPADATPDNNVIAYLDDIGFQAFYFFGFLTGACSLLLFTNATSPKQDPKALQMNLALFSTTRGYTIGALSVCLITLILYIWLW